MPHSSRSRCVTESTLFAVSGDALLELNDSAGGGYIHYDGYIHKKGAAQRRHHGPGAHGKAAPESRILGLGLGASQGARSGGDLAEALS